MLERKEQKIESPALVVAYSIVTVVMVALEVAYYTREQRERIRFLFYTLQTNWDAVTDSGFGLRTLFFYYLPIINLVLTLILVALIFGSYIYQYASSLRIEKSVKRKTTTLPYDAYMTYHTMAYFQESVSKVTESEMGEMAAAVYTDLRLVKTDNDKSRIKPFCTEDFFKRLSEDKVQALKNNDTWKVLYAFPYAWKRTGDTVQVIMKVSVQTTLKDSVRTDEYDMYFSVDPERKTLDILNCPRCGAPVDFNKSNCCAYCGTELQKYLSGWLIDDVKKIG